MAWDFILDRKTGDWVFDGNNDYMGVSGDELIRQRIFIRMKIPRGSFLYDADGILGSRAYQLLRFTVDRTARDLTSVIEEALEGLDEITIQGIDIVPNENNKTIRAVIHYSRNSADIDSVVPNERSVALTLPLPVSSAGLATD
jgi:hypothetical protein